LLKKAVAWKRFLDRGTENIKYKFILLQNCQASAASTRNLQQEYSLTHSIVIESSQGLRTKLPTVGGRRSGGGAPALGDFSDLVPK